MNGTVGLTLRHLLCAAVLLAPAVGTHWLTAQDLQLSPTRPTVANGSSIQNKGVLQVETGYDVYPQHVPGDQQTVQFTVTYAVLERLRLDYGWSAFNHQQGDDGAANGVGTMQLGGKFVLHNEEHNKPMPGLALQYEAELPTASNRMLQDYGQQFIVLVNHHYGRNGILDVIANGSVVQEECQSVTGCTYSGQQSLALSYHLNEKTRLYAEVFGQNNSESNTPPGTYAFGGFYHQLRDAFGIDGGMRFGLSNHSASVGATVGLVFGKRLRHGPSPPRSH